ncbi:helix-turn-helix domain-containing protein [Pseudomonas qingdaonensis]|nr:helix-turn-helix domain-containing protein [Pseudomonas qingdaonensis]
MTIISNNAPIMILAQAIRRERLQSGMSVSDLARRAGVAKSTLSQLESGLGNPSIETLWALATALGIQVTRFFEQPAQTVTVIRAGEGAALKADDADYAATLLADCPPGIRRDLYRVHAQPGQPHHSGAPGGHFRACIRARGRQRRPGQCTGAVACRRLPALPGQPAPCVRSLEPDTVAVMLIEHS